MAAPKTIFLLLALLFSSMSFSNIKNSSKTALKEHRLCSSPFDVVLPSASCEKTSLNSFSWLSNTAEKNKNLILKVEGILEKTNKISAQSILLKSMIGDFTYVQDLLFAFNSLDNSKYKMCLMLFIGFRSVIYNKLTGYLLWTL